jgi:protein-S-isoprenylcysteine O-methyltransferase Ste14
MKVQLIATIVYFIWLFGEGAFASSNSGREGRKNMDRSSRAWVRLALAFGIPTGLAVDFMDLGEVERAESPISMAGLLLLLSGIPLRYVAMRTLKQFYTPEVMISADHRVVTTGIYSVIRHPAYLGYLLIHLGLGLAFGNWLSVLFIFLPVLAGVLYRIKVEDEALKESLGDSYVSYSKARKRLIPGIY